MNQDEFLKCLELSKARHAEGDLESALRLAIKAQRMFDSPETTEWLQKVRKDKTEAKPESPFKDTTEPNTSDGVRQRKNIPNKSSPHQPPPESSQSRSSFSPEQVKEVKEFMKRNKDDYYKVLGVERTSNQDEIKKAYKKLALKFHPDKNQSPGADEAFKNISVAFSVLGDEEKRRNFDRFGTASLNNSSSAAANGFSGFNFPFASQQEEISPEELFNLFFGAAFSQAQSGFPPHHHQQQNHHNPFTQGHFGPGQFFFSSNFGGRQQQHRQRAANRPGTENEEFLKRCVQFIPLIIVLFLSLLSSWVFPGDNNNSYSSSSSTEHLFSLNPSSKHRFARSTRLKQIPYYATSLFQGHFEKLKEDDNTSKLFRELSAYENIIGSKFVSELRQSCEREKLQLAKMLKKAKKVVKTNFNLNSCEKLKKYE